VAVSRHGDEVRAGRDLDRPHRGRRACRAAVDGDISGVAGDAQQRRLLVESKVGQRGVALLHEDLLRLVAVAVQVRRDAVPARAHVDGTRRVDERASVDGDLSARRRRAERELRAPLLRDRGRGGLRERDAELLRLQLELRERLRRFALAAAVRRLREVLAVAAHGGAEALRLLVHEILPAVRLRDGK
jgi:hypothetical protein